MSEIPYIDRSGICKMKEFLLELSQKEIKYAFLVLQPQPGLLVQNISLEHSKNVEIGWCKKAMIQIS